ncbi:Sortase family protein [Streptomyces sp. YIM 130001]|uniref:class F sortase n=1 Tax=Streptomyces sp. YIM 130001 TaxID=2259644 RepID=UPI000E64DFFD|nr:class F sortase [Streptomyces sp. YIM 130001]RII17247.1 Sortase family protein [Streptomyces sp. YIM 130001]
MHPAPKPHSRTSDEGTERPAPEPRRVRARRRRTANVAIGGVSALALCAGVWLLGSAADADAPPQPTAAEAADHTGRDALPSAPALPAANPTGIRIPRIDVDAPLMDLHLTADGSLDVPPAGRSNLAGWYGAGTSPGERGTAIVAGHVDNAEGPAVFYALGALHKGDQVEVARADGRTALFTVDAVEVYDSRAFPDEKVYGAASRPELRIITCGGGYSKKTGYLGNVVVFAHLTGSRG